MPDLYLHATFAKDLKDIMASSVKEDVLLMGAQGPDPMYYAIFHKNSTMYRNLADRMHDTTTQTHLITLVNLVKNNLSSETYSFLMGYICHYALDVTLHPYVYYHVGIYDKTIKSTHEYRGLHLKFERGIDAVLMTRTLDKPPHKIPLHKTCMPQKEAPASIRKLMSTLLKKVYKHNNGDQIYNSSVQAMYKVLKRFVNDRFGMKKCLYKIIDRFHKNDMFLQDLSFYNHATGFDYLNEEHRSWYHPVTNEKTNASIPDLYEDAIFFATSLIKKTDQYLLGDADIDLTTVFTNLSFNSGIACDHKEPMKFFKNYTK